MSSDVKVGIRLRPLTKREKDENLPLQWIVKENSIVSLNQGTKEWEKNEFHFDYIFDTNKRNIDIFESIVKPLVDAAIDGYNGTIFCYGPVDTGKTYTMTGVSEEPGIIPYTIEYIFDVIQTIIKREFLLRVSYLEVCDEKVYDLLNKSKVDMRLCDNDSGKRAINFKEKTTNSANSMLCIMNKGIKNKKKREINRNEYITSHSIFRIIIESQCVEEHTKALVQVSQLNFVDSAGFEKIRNIDVIEKNGAGVTLSILESQIKQINQMQSLQEGVFDYSSKLTELLQSSFEGNAIAAIVYTVTPVAVEETYYTLQLASQVKDIKTNPERNELQSDTSLLIQYGKQLTKLQAELEKMSNEDAHFELEGVESSKFQQKYDMNCLLKERIKLLKSQIISGCTKDCVESCKCTPRRRHFKCNSGMFKQYLATCHTKTGLPTILEMSPDKPPKNDIMQSIDIINQTFETAFTDFELKLIDYEEIYEVNKTNSQKNEHARCVDNQIDLGVKNNDALETPEKQDSSVQTSSSHTSPSTPKSVLRRYLLDLIKDFNELQEFTTLEKQLMFEENHCCPHTLQEQSEKQETCNENVKSPFELIAQLDNEKSKLREDLELKVQELNEIKKDVQSLKLDIEKLEETIYLLTNENMEMSTKLSNEKEYAKEMETRLQQTIDDHYERILKLTDEKISYEMDVTVLKEQLNYLRETSRSESLSDEQITLDYKNRIEALRMENIELTAIISERNKELENVRESKSLLYDHECNYKDEVAILRKKNECLTSENTELTTDVVTKTEENDILKEEKDILRNKLSMISNVNTSEENDTERLRSENNILRAEISELKTRIATLSDENARFSYNLLETMENLDNSRNEKLSNNVAEEITSKAKGKLLRNEEYEEMSEKIVSLQDKVNQLTRLNKKLSGLKLSFCDQCTNLETLNESRRMLKVEAKMLSCKLEDLQRKFNQKYEDTEALRLKVNEELNVSVPDSSLNLSFNDSMNMSFVEEKVQYLNDELQELKNNNDTLSVLYKEKCDELEKLQDEGKNSNEGNKSKKRALKNETRIKQIQNSIDQVKDDIDQLKKNSTNFASILGKFRVEKASLLDEINALKTMNEELQQKMSDKETSETIAMEKAQILENEIQNMSKEIEEYSMKEKLMQKEKLTLEIELDDLKAEKENKDTLITGLHRTIDDLNDCISSLKDELDSVTNEKNGLANSAETMESKYRQELDVLQNRYDLLEKENVENLEAKTRATLWAKELETDVEKLQTNLETQENLYKELQKKVSLLENLFQESKDEKAMLNEKLQILERRLINSKENAINKYKFEFETISRNFEEYTRESEIKLNKINETLRKYGEESDNLTLELAKLREIEGKLKSLRESCQFMCSNDVSLNSEDISNHKFKEELQMIKKRMIRELNSLKNNTSSVDFLNKTADEIFIIFLQALMCKEEEIIRKMREMFEKDKQKLEDEVRQSADVEKRMSSWVKILESENEELKTDLTKKENVCKEQEDKIYQLQQELRESRHEKEVFKEKHDSLINDFNNLQNEYDKQGKTINERKEKALLVTQKREKEVQEAFKRKEIELRAKLKAEKEVYEKRIEELHCSIESYKTKNMELKGNVEGLEATEKQLRNIIEANATELKANEQTLRKMNKDFEQLTEDYNEIVRKSEEESSRVENITALLKNKCDMLSEYKAKLDTIMPDYELLQNQVKERKENIEKCKDEMEKLKMEKEMQIETIKDKLSSEEIKNVGLGKQLQDLNVKNVALIKELDALKEEHEELQRTNAKLQRKIRNSTSKLKAEAEMDDLRDMNKRLQHNLDGATNRISELQEDKNKNLKELVNLRGQYEMLSQENMEIKRALSFYKTKQSISCNSMDDSKYEMLVREKNKVALELEGKKLQLNQKDKEIKKCASQIKELSTKQCELDNRMKEYAATLDSRDAEITDLKVKLHLQQSENKLVNELEEKLKTLEKENRKLIDQLKTFKGRLSNNVKGDASIPLNRDECHKLQMERTELKKKVHDAESKEKLSGGDNNNLTSVNSRRRRSRDEMFNQRRQLGNVAWLNDVADDEETCKILRKKIRELELQLVTKNGQIAALEIQIQSENFPYQEKCRELEESLLAMHRKNSELHSETRKLQRTLNDINGLECDTCRRWRIHRREQACQTASFDEITDDHEKISKLEKEKAIIRDICRSRCRQVKDLEDKIRELEEAQMSSSKRIEFLEKKSNSQYSTAIQISKQLELDKSRKP